MPRFALFLAAFLFIVSCSLPRGAPLDSEILTESNDGEATFAVVPVTRAALPEIAEWPATGWKGFYRWVEGTRGPASNVIRTGDKVDLVVWDSQENSLLTASDQKTVKMAGLPVSPTGTIFVPYVGEVLVRGLTPDGARMRIQTDMEKIVPAAQVQLDVQAGQDNSVDLVGGVASPGNYPLPNRNTTILSLLAQGGGISASLRNPLVRLVRSGTTYEIRAEDLFAVAARDIVLRGGDKVIVEEDKRYFIALGATGNEELVYFDKERVSALEALSMLGGISDTRANPQGVLVLREYPRQAVRTGAGGPDMTQVIFTIDLTSADGLFAARNFQVNPNDTVLATESPAVNAQSIFGLVGAILGLRNQL